MSLFEFASAWLLGILTISLTNDNTAIAQCREDLIELEKELESSRTDSNGYSDKIKKIKQTLKKLNIHFAGLFIHHYELQKLIEKSLEVIYRMENNFSEPQNIPSNIIIELSDPWGSTPDLGKYQATKIKELQKTFFCKGLSQRTLYFIKNNPIKIISLVLTLILILILIVLYRLYINNVIEYSSLNLTVNLNI